MDEADELALVAHRDVVWTLPESIRSDFVVLADELAHHQRVAARLMACDPGALWRIPSVLAPQRR